MPEIHGKVRASFKRASISNALGSSPVKRPLKVARNGDLVCPHRSSEITRKNGTQSVITLDKLIRPFVSARYRKAFQRGRSRTDPIISPPGGPLKNATCSKSRSIEYTQHSPANKIHLINRVELEADRENTLYQHTARSVVVGCIWRT